MLLVCLISSSQPALAHDASAYGGVFRSRGMGASWLNADVGLFLSAALAVAVDPRDPNHLLMGTNAGLLASANGGRSWTNQVPQLIAGAAFAVSFSPDGATALCAAPNGIYRDTGSGWHHTDAPAAATPGRAIVFGQAPGHIYLLGRDQLFRSTDDGIHFAQLPGNLTPGAALEAVAILRQPAETLFAIAGGRLFASTDGGQRWQQRPAPEAPIDTVITDPAAPGRVWIAVADQLHLSTDAGLTWQPFGNRLPEQHTTVRGIAADPAATTLVVTTHRGTYRSSDAGAHWVLAEGNLPVHLEAGPLTRDPTDPGIIYIVYSLIPYPEMWRSALDGSNLLARVDPISLLGGGAFLLLLGSSGILLVIWLRRASPGTVR